MNRRSALRLTGTAILGNTLTGCLTSSGHTQSTTTQPLTDGSTTTAEKTSTTTTDSTLSPCVPARTDHASFCADEDTAPFSITLTPANPSLSKVIINVKLTNTTDEGLSGGRNDFSLEKRLLGRWNRVVPHGGGTDMDTLAPGESWDWSFVVNTTDLESPYPPDDSDGVHLRLGAGTYSFTYTGSVGGSEPVTVGRRFVLSGDPLKPMPTRSVERTHRNDDTVYVTSHRPRLKEYEPRRATLIVSQSNTPATSLDRFDHFLLEDLYNGFPSGLAVPLRNAVAYFDEGVTTVRVKTDANTTPAFGVHPPKTVAVDNQTYRLTVEDPNR